MIPHKNSFLVTKIGKNNQIPNAFTQNEDNREDEDSKRRMHKITVISKNS